MYLLWFRRPALIALLGLFAALTPALRAQDYDLVIRRARLVDGTGGAATMGDLAVKAGRIAVVGQVSGQGRTEIDAAGMVVAPGFIDVHTHSENVTELPVAENFLRMGVTTIVTGNCGGSKLEIEKFFAALQQARIALNVATLAGTTPCVVR